MTPDLEHTPVRVRLANRRGQFLVCIGDPADPQMRPPFEIGFGFIAPSWHVAEVFVAAGKGDDLDTILGEVFIALSRGLQRRPARRRLHVPAVRRTLLREAELAVPVTILLERHQVGPLAGDLAAIGLRAPRHAGLDRSLILLGAELTLALVHLPPLAGRAGIEGRPIR